MLNIVFSFKNKHGKDVRCAGLWPKELQRERGCKNAESEHVEVPVNVHLNIDLIRVSQWGVQAGECV